MVQFLELTVPVVGVLVSFVGLTMSLTQLTLTARKRRVAEWAKAQQNGGGTQVALETTQRWAESEVIAATAVPLTFNLVWAPLSLIVLVVVVWFFPGAFEIHQGGNWLSVIIPGVLVFLSLLALYAVPIRQEENRRVLAVDLFKRSTSSSDATEEMRATSSVNNIQEEEGGSDEKPPSKEEKNPPPDRSILKPSNRIRQWWPSVCKALWFALSSMLLVITIAIMRITGLQGTASIVWISILGCSAFVFLLVGVFQFPSRSVSVLLKALEEPSKSTS